MIIIFYPPGILHLILNGLNLITVGRTSGKLPTTQLSPILMAGKLKIIELNYYSHQEFSTPAEVIDKHKPSNLFAGALIKSADIILVKHLDYEGEHIENGIRYRFFRSTNNFTHIPFKTHRFIKKESPDIVLVQGLIFPLQVIALRLKLGKKCRIVLQHHAEVPFKKKKILQKIADRYVKAYFFTSMGNAEEWLSAGVIKDRKKIFEVPHSSTTFVKQDKGASKEQKGMSGQFNFLWVGRLNANKDPLTVLAGFEKYGALNSDTRLYMIFGEKDLLGIVQQKIRESDVLSKTVILVGEIKHTELQTWYSAADYFLSGSHREGGGYALTEALACGCIPVVTNIPPFMKAIGGGNIGYYYEPGNPEELYNVLATLNQEKQEELSIAAQNHFKEYLSAKAIAMNVLTIFETLATK